MTRTSLQVVDLSLECEALDRQVLIDHRLREVEVGGVRVGLVLAQCPTQRHRAVVVVGVLGLWVMQRLG